VSPDGGSVFVTGEFSGTSRNGPTTPERSRTMPRPLTDDRSRLILGVEDLPRPSDQAPAVDEELPGEAASIPLDHGRSGHAHPHWQSARSPAATGAILEPGPTRPSGKGEASE